MFIVIIISIIFIMLVIGILLDDRIPLKWIMLLIIILVLLGVIFTAMQDHFISKGFDYNQAKYQSGGIVTIFALVFGIPFSIVFSLYFKHKYKISKSNKRNIS